MEQKKEAGQKELLQCEQQPVSQKYSFFNIFLSKDKEEVQKTIALNYSIEEVELSLSQKSSPEYCIIKKQYRQKKSKTKEKNFPIKIEQDVTGLDSQNSNQEENDQKNNKNQNSVRKNILRNFSRLYFKYLEDNLEEFSNQIESIQPELGNKLQNYFYQSLQKKVVINQKNFLRVFFPFQNNYKMQLPTLNNKSKQNQNQFQNQNSEMDIDNNQLGQQQSNPQQNNNQRQKNNNQYFGSQQNQFQQQQNQQQYDQLDVISQNVTENNKQQKLKIKYENNHIFEIKYFLRVKARNFLKNEIFNYMDGIKDKKAFELNLQVVLNLLDKFENQ